jgi:uncharacterized RDD family membrane protein YckC
MRQARIAARTESRTEGTLGALSTQPNLTPQWKEEVNRRIAAHKNRRAQSSAQESTQQASLGESRAAQAAARVAARYAKAPSYTQMQAEETRVAVRAAEIATKVALEAQEAAHAALAEMHAATQEQSRGPAVVHTIPVPPAAQPLPTPPVASPAMPSAASEQRPEHAGVAIEAAPRSAIPATAPAVDIEEKQPEPRRILGIRWDPDLPRRSADKKPDPRRAAREEFELSTEDWWNPAEVAESLRSNPIEVGEGDQLHANLIQFPRELVATRKIRPHAGMGTEPEPQLSIFEVDPASISTEAGMPLAEQGGAASIWSPEWSGMKLDTQPAQARAATRESNYAAARLPVAPFGLRIMATVVDCALILASFVMVGFLVAHSTTHPPTGKAAELLGLAGLGLIGILYYGAFFALPVSTPGMKYAGIGLCTFDDQSPTRLQLRRRLGAMFLSLLPVGLGLVWSIFDEDHLSWHDRYSQTYLRKL